MNPELVEKYADQTQHPRMLGTGGGMDYLIIAKKPELNLQLGIKPLVSVGKNGPVAVGFRLRSAPIPGGIVHQIGETPQVTQGYPSTGWAFPWEKVNEDRASLIRMFSFDRKPEEIGFLWEDLKQHRFYGKLHSFLLEKVEGEQLTATTDEISEFFQACLYPVVLAVKSKTDPAAKLELLKAQKSDLDGKIAAEIAKAEAEVADKGATAATDEPEYKPTTASAEFGTSASVSAMMLQGMKPSLSVVDNESLSEEAAAALGDDEEDFGIGDENEEIGGNAGDDD